MKNENLVSIKFIRVKFPLQKVKEVDASCFRPSLERIEGLWIVCYIERGGGMSLFEKW